VADKRRSSTDSEAFASVVMSAAEDAMERSRVLCEEARIMREEHEGERDRWAALRAERTARRGTTAKP